MILLKKCLLAFFGLCAGGIIAAGVYAFLAIIGVFVRLMGKTGTRKHIFLYETVIILGGVLGNILDIYEFPIYMGPYIGTLFICVFGLSVGFTLDNAQGKSFYNSRLTHPRFTDQYRIILFTPA